MLQAQWTIIGITMSLLGGFQICNSQMNTRGNIPEFLIDCYRNDNLHNRANRFPMTMDNFISLVRKIELSAGANMDMRVLAVTLLQSFRMDGIERNPEIAMSEGVTPYRPSGRQFNKHKILLEQLIPGNANQLSNDTLTLSEKCALHFMLSSSVDPWERGDEHVMCVETLSSPMKGQVKAQTKSERIRLYYAEYPAELPSGAQISRCPIEEGVVTTNKYGTVNPGAVLAGIAAALERQQVKIAQLLTEPTEHEKQLDGDRAETFEKYQMLSQTDEGLVDNLWASTLAGDLAEVAVWQGPRLTDTQSMTIGPDGRWNNTFVPRAFYMDETNAGYWEMTDAETRGGLDGFILGTQVKTWVNTLNRFKLSQMLEMYYSDRGVNFDPNYRACERRSRVREHITPSQLLTQTSNFARVLSYQLGNVQIEDETLKQFCEMAVLAAKDHEATLLNDQQCSLVFKNDPKVQLTVIMDGTWRPENAFQILMYLAAESDVSFYGSKMAIINGKTGEVMLTLTSNTTELFDNVTITNTTWPTGLDLFASLSTAYNLIGYEMSVERMNNVIGGPNHVIVVMAYSSTITDIDFKQSREKINEIRTNQADVRILYLTSEINRVRFQQLLTMSPFATDDVLTAPDQNTDTVVPLIINSIRDVPTRIMGQTCQSSSSPSTKAQFEDYVTPGETRLYRVHPQYLGSNSIKIWILGSGYGDLNICLSRDIQEQWSSNCTKEVQAHQQIEFLISNPCGTSGSACQPVYLAVSGKNTMTKCTEDDCRFPHQIRYTIHHEGMNCVVDVNTGALSSAVATSYWTTMFYLTQLVPPLLAISLFR